MRETYVVIIKFVIEIEPSPENKSATMCIIVTPLESKGDLNLVGSQLNVLIFYSSQQVRVKFNEEEFRTRQRTQDISVNDVAFCY